MGWNRNASLGFHACKLAEKNSSSGWLCWKLYLQINHNLEIKISSLGTLSLTNPGLLKSYWNHTIGKRASAKIYLTQGLLSPPLVYGLDTYIKYKGLANLPGKADHLDHAEVLEPGMQGRQFAADQVLQNTLINLNRVKCFKYWVHK